MTLRTSLATAITVLALATVSGCAVTRGQEGAGAYVDDASITTSVKAKMAENHDVDATAITVETLKGEVMLSGFARNSLEKSTAERLARETKGVKSVRNEIAVRP